MTFLSLFLLPDSIPRIDSNPIYTLSTMSVQIKAEEQLPSYYQSASIHKRPSATLSFLSSPLFQTLTADAAISFFSAIILRVFQFQLVTSAIKSQDLSYLCSHATTTTSHSAYSTFIDPNIVKVCLNNEATRFTYVGELLEITPWIGIVLGLILFKSFVTYFLCFPSSDEEERSISLDDHFNEGGSLLNTVVVQEDINRDQSSAPYFDYLFNSVFFHLVLMTVLVSAEDSLLEKSMTYALYGLFLYSFVALYLFSMTSCSSVESPAQGELMI